MQRRHGRFLFKKQKSAWGLTALLLLALLGISLVTDPATKAGGTTPADPALTPAAYEPRPDAAFADRAYAVSVGKEADAAYDGAGRDSKDEPRTGFRRADEP